MPSRLQSSERTRAETLTGWTDTRAAATRTAGTSLPTRRPFTPTCGAACAPSSYHRSRVPPLSSLLASRRRRPAVSMERRKAFLLGSAILYLSRWGCRSLPPETKQTASRLVNRLFEAGERHGLVEHSPGFRRDYLRDYPELEILERHHAAIRRECVALLGIKDRLTDVEALGGSYTADGIHAIRWKSFVF